MCISNKIVKYGEIGEKYALSDEFYEILEPQSPLGIG